MRGKGYVVIVGGRVRPVADTREAAIHVADSHRAGKSARVRARVSLTRERDLTMAETVEIADLAAAEILAMA